MQCCSVTARKKSCFAFPHSKFYGRTCFLRKNIPSAKLTFFFNATIAAKFDIGLKFAVLKVYKKSHLWQKRRVFFIDAAALNYFISFENAYGNPWQQNSRNNQHCTFHYFIFLNLFYRKTLTSTLM